MNDRTFVIWKGHGSDQGIYSARNDHGTDFNDARQVSWFASSRGIAAVVEPVGHGIRAAWRGADNDNRIWTAAGHFTGDSWGEQFLPSGVPRTEDRPALGVLGERVIMAWRGAGQDEHIWYSVLGPGGWSPQQLASDGTASSTHGPALAQHDGRLFMAWKGSGGNQNLYWCTYDGQSWTAPKAFPGGSTHGPALASNGAALVMAWKGSGDDDRLWRAGYGNGGWSAQQLAIGRSSHGPALGRVDNRIVMTWKGAGGDERLWWTPDSFRTQLPLRAGYTSSNSPAIVALNFADL
ncbi:hypothetical protein [Streptomyces sp. NPDC001492]